MTIKDGKKLLDRIKTNSPQLVDIYDELDDEDKELVCYFGLRLSSHVINEMRGLIEWKNW